MRLDRAGVGGLVAGLCVLGLLSSAGDRTAGAPDSKGQDRLLWSADMEEGSLADWTSSGQGGEFNSGDGDTLASRDRAHSGNWSARSTTAVPLGGVATPP